ncbi:TetR family transcriptional regulator [Nocardia mangyaensis]|uniref:TetR family transcriptional regulator n=1 Tax=Nocardia mangyaensis TaxID=2213200 RepID=A0A1J0VT16_9NOCA|nr:TetR family transcriptional regulator [Nocardia mangyaensis]APE35161.1 TetR family transcriptional regulator [Nocardia mangyaensis]
MRAAGAATRERILDAAKAEFARYGVAGARINRIAAAARASKDRLYAYFPGKNELYAAVTERWTGEVSAETALSAEDVPAYVGRLFDHFVAHPDNARLQAWADLEPSGDHVAQALRATLETKHAELRRGQRAGLITADIAAPLLLLMLTDLARTTATRARFAAEHSGSDQLAAQRAATVLAAQRITAP